MADLNAKPQLAQVNYMPTNAPFKPVLGASKEALDYIAREESFTNTVTKGLARVRFDCATNNLTPGYATPGEVCAIALEKSAEKMFNGAPISDPLHPYAFYIPPMDRKGYAAVDDAVKARVAIDFLADQELLNGSKEAVSSHVLTDPKKLPQGLSSVPFKATKGTAYEAAFTSVIEHYVRTGQLNDVAFRSPSSPVSILKEEAEQCFAPQLQATAINHSTCAVAGGAHAKKFIAAKTAAR